MAAASGASTRELMARGGWSTVAMVTRDQHATEDRGAFLAKANAPFVLPGGQEDGQREGQQTPTPALRAGLRTDRARKKNQTGDTPKPGR